jgi:hypothetical protein
MKLIPRIIPVLFFAATLAHSQDAVSTVPPKYAASPVPLTTARILGAIPDGTPPPPAPPKPEFHIASRDILDTATHEQGGRKITIRQIKPINLPPPPAPMESSAGADEAYRARLADYRAAHPRVGLLFLGATVFLAKDSPPRTLVQYWPEGNRGSITFWSSADFALIAGGIQSFADTSGNTHSIFMGWGCVDIDRMAERMAAHGRAYVVPAIPKFPEGKATFKIDGESPAAEDLVAIQSLHDLYNTEYTRLKTAYAGREKARIEHEAYLKANPPQPKDITLNYWRVEKSASTEKGGAAR